MNTIGLVAVIAAGIFLGCILVFFVKNSTFDVFKT